MSTRRGLLSAAAGATAGRRAGLSADDVEREFDATAGRYDLMVSLNPGYHEQLRSAAALLADRLPRGRRLSVVDLGCGSGASTSALVDRLTAAAGIEPADVELLGVDASAGMIAQARAKRWPAGVRFERGRAEDVAERAGEWGLRRPVDGVLACYLFRNLADPGAGLSAVHEVLAPGAALVVQEYSVAGSVRATLVWTAICWLVVIPLSALLTRRTRLYRYLWRSVLRFDSVPRFQRRLTEAGYAHVSVHAASGWQRGILHTFVAHKPS